ncbi:MAG: ATP-dependent Clp protease ATP-binding subunit [Candidatus Komeilibacteria bacterium]|nr:ATP-dependent Clp protease ATP-binding subunit [Candidatus Komeilibacteria bacterium]
MAPNFFTEKFTVHLKQALLRAQSLAEMEITTDNILDALAQEKGSIASEIINKTKRAKADAPELPLPAKISSTAVLSIPAAEKLIKAVQISQQYGHKYVGTEHLLKSLSISRQKEVLAWWQRQTINVAELEKNLQIVLESTSKFPDLTAVFRSNATATENKEERLQATLEYFGRELTSQDVQKDIDPVIGREREINRLIHVLCRRYKNNPLLLGEAGVGKTAIVEGLAKKIASGEVPPILANKKIFTIDLGALVAGTIYRGEFEARFKNLIEAAESANNIILFIDEIHTIIGAGSASGSLDAANMLKPALARGKVSIIGATTMDEYKKHIETDSALERRLQPILIEEPNEDETLAVLAGIKDNYERFHNVTITSEAISTAVKLSNRYLTEKLQPDKAIDLIDEAAARVKVERSQKSIWQKIRKTEAALAQARSDKRQAVHEENYSQAIGLKQVEAELDATLKTLMAEAHAQDNRKGKVTAEHILAVVASLTKIPLGELAQQANERLIDLEIKLQNKIIGQKDALSQIAGLIRRSHTEVADPKKPLASFIFLGPSGVGKTETAKQLANFLFPDAKGLIKVDMSEFAESFTVSRLIGAPAGYVGYRDSNKFTDLVRRRPHSIILLDEIEKAHGEIFNILLQVLEDGQLTDATGRTVNFKNTIIIMTSNLGLTEFNQAAHLGFSAGEESNNFNAIAKRVSHDLKNHFRPEFLNRVDQVVVFKPLSNDDLRLIVDIYLEELNQRLASKKLAIKLTDAAREFIVKTAYDPNSGARGIRRYLQDNIESQIAARLLDKNLQTADIVIDLNDNKNKLEFISA